MPIGPDPTGTVAGVCPQPDLACALQIAPLNTETLLSLLLVTWTVSVARSTAIALGPFPTVTVGHGPWHRETSCALHRRLSITDTVFPPAAGPFVLKPSPT